MQNLRDVLAPAQMSEARKKFFHYIFTTAMEGGIGYWSVASEYHWSKPNPSDSVEDLDGFYAILESSEDDWGVEEAWIAECGETLDITETQSLRVDLKVIERGWDMFMDKVLAAVKTEDRDAGFSRHYFRQFVVQYLTDMEEGDSDADGCDLVVQLGLFGEVVYG